MYDDQKSNQIKSPLTSDQIKIIDGLDLSTIEKHHLRLLGHCLESFKEMPGQIATNQFPSKKDQISWCLNNPQLEQDEEFISILLNQFAAAAINLEEIASSINVPPMELTLNDLIEYTLNKE